MNLSSVIVERTDCPSPQCSSSDGYTVYDDGHGKCYVCNKFTPPTDELSVTENTAKGKEIFTDKVDIDFSRGLKKRCISQETCQKFRYGMATKGGEKQQVIEIRDNKNNLCGYKFRSRDKDFSVRGKLPKLIGMNLYSGGKTIVITEGEIDMLSVSQVFGNKYPVVSLTNGAQSAKAAVNENREYLSNFETIVLMLDTDEAGTEAAKAAANCLTDMDVRIATVAGYKDANEALQAGESRKIVEAFWNAKTYSPAELSTLADDVDELLKPIENGDGWWLPELDEITYGRRAGELFTFGAGTGVGKTDFITQQIAHDVVKLRRPVGVFYLEMSKPEFAKRLASKLDSCLYHVPNSGTSKEDLKKTLTRAEMKNVHFYSAFGVNVWSEIKNHIIFLANKGVKHFYIDHLTALATGGDKSEKEELEMIMAEVAGVGQQYGLIIHLISHLSTPEKGSHEEGARVTIRQFKGARAIGFWSFFMFGLERDQQTDDIDERNITKFRVLKNRLTGDVGKCISLNYSHETGLLSPHVQSPFHGEGTKSGTDDY